MAEALTTNSRLFALTHLLALIALSSAIAKSYLSLNT